MKHFLKKQLPAFLLAVLLVAGVMPSALAANCPNGQHKWSSWQKQDDGTHVRTCLVSGCTATESAAHTWESSYSTDASSHWKKCSVCGAEQAHTAHNFRSDLQKDAASHWEQCDTCGYRANEGGHLDKNLDGKCDTCGYSTGTPYVTVTFMNGTSTFKTQANVAKGAAPANPGTPTKTASGKVYTFKGWTTTNPGSSALYNGQAVLTSAQVAATAVSANTTYYAVYTVASDGLITYEVDPGDTVSLDRSDFKDLFDTESGNGSFRYVRFYPNSSYKSSNGVFYYDYEGNDETAFAKGDLEDNDFYYRSSSYGDYPLDALTFVADKDADGKTVTVDLRLYGDDGYVSGSLKIEIDDDRSDGDGDLTYKVEAGEAVDFDRGDFQALFIDEYPDDSFRYVCFYPDSSYKSSNGVLYYDYDGTNEEAFTKSDLEDYDFYYRSSSYGDYPLDKLTFVAGKDADGKTVTLDCRLYGDDDYLDATVEIRIGDTDDDGDITYTVAPGKEVSFDSDDFNDYFQDEANSSYDIKYVTFSTTDTLSKSTNGLVYAGYGKSGEKSFSKTTIDDFEFYYSKSSDGDYALDDLSFVASDDFTGSVTLSFTAWYSSSKKASGKVVIKSTDSGKADITYTVEPGKEVVFDSEDFNDFFQDEANSSYDIKYVTFSTDDTLNKTATGLLYVNYGKSGEKSLTKSTLEDFEFYYSKSSDGDYALDSLSFVAGSLFSAPITLSFTAWYSSTQKVSGKLVIQPASKTVIDLGYQGDILYSSTGAAVQIKPSDISRFLKSKYPSAMLQSVVLGGVPSIGSLYYNYYGASSYGASRLLLNAGTCKQYTFYANPSSASQYALTELLYVPSGTNYCTSIPFTAYGTGGLSASGTILISVNRSAVGEVYGATPKNAAVSFPASSIYSVVFSATGASLDSIQLLKLPAANVGAVYVGTSTPANILTKYGYSSGTQQISQLRFVPTNGYTGSVEIPYVAYNSSGAAVAAGKFCLGVVNNLKKFSDVTSSTWCYKYVAELADGKVIDGYTDGTFKPDNTITYGAALKLIMLAAGYPEQKPTGTHAFSGYLDKARAEGIITRSNVELNKPITRLQVAQLAAGAMKLDTSNLSSVKPFTDTDDASVQALNAAGIVEGYTSGGTSTYKPNNTLTRGQVSAIVWRMRNYQK